MVLLDELDAVGRAGISRVRGSERLPGKVAGAYYASRPQGLENVLGNAETRRADKRRADGQTVDRKTGRHGDGETIDMEPGRR